MRAGTSAPEAGVASGSLSWVDADGWNDFWDAVGGHGDAPFAVVGKVVVGHAEQAAALDVGASPFCPGVDVMRFAPGGGPVTTRPDAASVGGGESDPLVAVEQPFGAAEIEDGGAAVEHHRQQTGVAGQSTGLAG